MLWNVVLGYVSADEAIEDLNTRYNAALESGLPMEHANVSLLRTMIRFSRQQEPLPIKQSKTLSGYGCRKEKDACIHMDPLPWKDSAMERQEYMDAGSIKNGGQCEKVGFFTRRNGESYE